MLIADETFLSPAQLDDNEARLVTRLEPLVAGYESRFGVRSEDLAGALASGAIPDTDEVCEWAIAWETLLAVRGGRSSRVE